MLANLVRPLALLALCLAPALPMPAQDTSPGERLPLAAIESLLPIRSERLTPGEVTEVRRSTGVTQPFFLVGCDPRSIEWIGRNRARLRAIGAFGLVIDAPDVEAYRALEQSAVGILLRPVAGDLIAEHLGIRHYPVLVTADGIFP